MKDNLEEYLRNELQPASYPFEEKHWDGLKSKMYSKGRLSAFWLMGALLLGVVQMSVTYPHIIESHLEFPASYEVVDVELFGGQNEVVAQAHEIVTASEIADQISLNPSHEEPLQLQSRVSLPSPQQPKIGKTNALQIQFGLQLPTIKASTEILDFPSTAMRHDLSLYATPQFQDVGLNIRFHLSSSIFFGTGVEYYRSPITFETPGRMEQHFAVEDNSYWTTQSSSAWVYTDSAQTAIGDWTYTDSTYITTIDSSYNAQFDTALVTRNVSAQRTTIVLNKVSIPFIVGISKQIGRTELGLQLGGSIDYLLRAETTGDQGLTNVASEINYSLLAGAYVDYRLTEHFSVGIQPTFRRSLGIDVKSEAHSLRASNFNVRGYIRFRLR